jgi:hypothetical protein
MPERSVQLGWNQAALLADFCREFVDARITLRGYTLICGVTHARSADG